MTELTLEQIELGLAKINPFKYRDFAKKHEEHIASYFQEKLNPKKDPDVMPRPPRQKKTIPTPDSRTYEQRRADEKQIQRDRRATVMNIAKFHDKPVRIAIYESALGLSKSATSRLLREMKKEGLLDQRTIFIKGEGQFSAYMEASDGLATD